MPLLTCKNLNLHIGLQALLDKADLVIEPGERICLLGRNGEGKSTLMRVLMREMAVDGGEIQHESGLRIAQLQQTVPQTTEGLVFDVVAEGLGELGHTLAEYHRLTESADPDLEQMARLQTRLEAQDGWTIDSQVTEVLSRLKLDGSQNFSALSGGLKRRVLLAQALVTQPDLLLLDEPTNHLDVDSIAWLEDFLLQWNGSLLFITHDRAFLRRLATRIIELDRG
ncbi:MAG: ATP-binding cassette domain-containing protein, partial [Oceanococcus sp.]